MKTEMETDQKKMVGQPDGACIANPPRLTFAELRTKNVKRTAEAFHRVEAWSPTDWATAMAGECGEACNLIKKMRRGDLVHSSHIADELADLIIYTDLLAERLGIDLEEAIIHKFNAVSDRLRPLSRIRL